MVDREHAVGLAATKGGLQLDHRVAALAGEALGDGDQQQAHAFGDEGAGEEGLGVLVLRRRGAVGDLRDVSGELGLLEGALEHVLVGAGDLAPGFEAHSTPLFRVR